MKFVVDRQTWFRGKGSMHSRLLTQKGQRCCIGFVGQQCGIKDEDLLEVAAIHSGPKMEDGTVNSLWPNWMKNLKLVPDIKLGEEQTEIGTAYKINDNQNITDAEREKRLQELFSRNGDEIEFIN